MATTADTTQKHTYLRTHQISGRLLAYQLTEEEERLRARAAASRSGRAAKTLIKDGPLRITLIALRKDAALQSHRVAGAVSVQILSGSMRLTTASRDLPLATRGLAALDAGVGHAAVALSDCTILITMAMA